MKDEGWFSHKLPKGPIADCVFIWEWEDIVEVKEEQKEEEEENEYNWEIIGKHLEQVEIYWKNKISSAPESLL